MLQTSEYIAIDDSHTVESPEWQGNMQSQDPALRNWSMERKLPPLEAIF